MLPADRQADRPGDSPDNRPPPPGAARAHDAQPLPLHAEELLNAALRATVLTGADDVPLLQEALRAYVRALRNRGEPPERVLIAVKDRVYDAVRRRPTLPAVDASALVQRVVHWAIEAYYRAD